MTMKEQLTEKKQALIDLEPMLKADDVSEEIIAQGEALATEIADLEAQIEKAEKAIADYQKAIVSFQNGLTDLETKFQNVSDKLETAKAEMGVLAEGLALAKSNYEAIMNYIKTESEGSLIIPVTLNEIMKVIDNLDIAGIDVSSLLSKVSGAVSSLL